MRGKGIQKCDGRVRVGITPAYAGKRAFELVVEASDWDHPRVCGEKASALSALVVKEGSPPRMRGKDAVEMQQLEVSKITPAYAGKRKTAENRAQVIKDHPRVCGEKCKFNGVCGIVVGITPAYAGKSSSKA